MIDLPNNTIFRYSKYRHINRKQLTAIYSVKPLDLE